LAEAAEKRNGIDVVSWTGLLAMPAKYESFFTRKELAGIRLRLRRSSLLIRTAGCIGGCTLEERIHTRDCPPSDHVVSLLRMIGIDETLLWKAGNMTKVDSAKCIA
jgi:hypothetical protein